MEPSCETMLMIWVTSNIMRNTVVCFAPIIHSLSEVFPRVFFLSFSFSGKKLITTNAPTSSLPVKRSLDLLWIFCDCVFLGWRLTYSINFLAIDGTLRFGVRYDTVRYSTAQV